MEEHPVKIFPTVGCCGIDCGLCPRYHTAGASRCPGCAGLEFFEKHPSCGHITCCVKKRKLEVCSQCDEYPCSKFESWAEGDSFVTHLKTLSNLNSIRGEGLEEFAEQQRKRIGLLKTMLEEFDDGRSKSYYCLATALLPVTALEESLHRAQEQINKAKAKSGDIKTRARILRDSLDDSAAKTGVELKLRHMKHK
jgi:hypothetical protein